MVPHPTSSIPFWRRLNRLRNQQRSDNIGKIEKDRFLISNDSEKANSFADRMETVFGEDPNPRYNTEHKEKIVKFIANSELEKFYCSSEKVIT